ncbi:MAG: hypothetical protein FJY46_10490 [Betaproteobacteria bacterium]|nr:hypothetical protein [Betaproteobacteria bacterium]
MFYYLLRACLGLNDHAKHRKYNSGCVEMMTSDDIRSVGSVRFFRFQTIS